MERWRLSRRSASCSDAAGDAPAMGLSNRIFNRSAIWQGKALRRLLLLLAAAAAVAALASRFGVSHDYSYVRASLLSGAPSGRYHAIGTRLAARAKQEHGRLTVIPTAGSVEKCRSPGPRSDALRCRLRPGAGWHSRTGRCRPRVVGPPPRTRISAAPRTAGSQVSHLCRSTRDVDRNRPGRLGDRLSYASAL